MNTTLVPGKGSYSGNAQSLSFSPTKCNGEVLDFFDILCGVTKVIHAAHHSLQAVFFYNSFIFIMLLALVTKP